MAKNSLRADAHVKVAYYADSTNQDGSSDAAGDGQGNQTGEVNASKSAIINGILEGDRWTSKTITYSDPDSADDYQPGYDVDGDNDNIGAQYDGFAQISAAQLRAVRFALDTAGNATDAGFSVEGFTGLNIKYAGSGTGNANIRVANTSDNDTGLGYYPRNTPEGGDAWMGTLIQNPVQGGYEWNNTLHELGHVLGLKHGQVGGGPGNTALPTAYDSLEYTVMTYRSYVGEGLDDGYDNGDWDYPQTYMMADIAALQYMYGADFKTNSGKTVYQWSPSSGNTLVNGEVALQPGGTKIFATIWDGGGAHDTYNLSQYTTSVEIDLRPGQASTFSSSQLADLGFDDGAGQHFAGGNIYNALLYKNDRRSLIEDAIGGSAGDTLMGNQGKNWLKGGLGDDTMTGGKAQDTFFFRTGWGTDTVTDFTAKGKTHDLLDLSGWTAITSFKDLIKHHTSNDNGDVVITAGADSVILEDLIVKQLDKDHFIL